MGRVVAYHMQLPCTQIAQSLCWLVDSSNFEAAAMARQDIGVNEAHKLILLQITENARERGF